MKLFLNPPLLQRIPVAGHNFLICRKKKGSLKMQHSFASHDLFLHIQNSLTETRSFTGKEYNTKSFVFAERLSIFWPGCF